MNSRHATKEEAVKLQSRAEAHLYIAIAKADGIVSKKERVYIGVYAADAQKLYDVLDINSAIAVQVQVDIRQIIADSSFTTWTTENHYNEAAALLRKARASGNWSVALSSLKHEHGLLKVALLDEYIFAESAAVKDILGRLERDFGGAENPTGG